MNLQSLAGSPRYRADPYPALAALREAGPVQRTATGQYVLTHFDDVDQVLRDPRTGNAAPQGEAGGVAGIRHVVDSGATRPISVLDPPEHGRVRRALHRAMPRDLAGALRRDADRLAAELLDKVAARDGEPVDVVAELALPLPLTLICDLLGVPDDDRGTLVGQVRTVVRNAEPDELLDPGERARARTAERDLTAYFARLLVRRKRRPTGDVLSSLARDTADAPDRLAFDELVANVAFLFVNGYHNTVSQVTLGLSALMAHPEQLAALRRDPGLDAPMVEELLRYDSPIQSIARVTREAYPLRALILPPGTPLIAMVGAAHRDPAAFAEPDRLWPGRPGPRRVLSFGGGVHYCLGAGLARMEATALLGGIARRFATVEPAGDPEWTPSMTLRGLERLPVRFTR
jgi:cytochrome P450